MRRSLRLKCWILPHPKGGRAQQDGEADLFYKKYFKYFTENTPKGGSKGGKFLLYWGL